MAEFNVPIFDFRSGVLTPKLKDRVNLDIYKSGVLIGENFLTQLHGPTEFRPGFMYSRPTRRNKKAWGGTFSFDDNEAYVMEFTDGYLRFHSDEGVIVETTKDIEDITAADPGVIEITTHGYADGDEIFIDGIVGTDELNGSFFLVVWIDADTFSLTDLDGNAIDTTAYGAYVSGGTTARVYELQTPYQEDELNLIKYAQKADLMFINHPSRLPRRLTRRGLTDWVLEIYTRTNDPFEQRAVTGITKANPGVVTSAGHGYVNGDVILIEGTVGMTEVNEQEYTVTKLNNDTFSIVDTSGFTAYTSGGYTIKVGYCPSAVGFYGGRLFHGGGDEDSDMLFGSRSPDPLTGEQRYTDHTVGADADHAVVFALTSASQSSVDRIRFFAGTRQFLAVGTYAGMLKVNGGSDSVPISGTAIESFPVDSFGVANILPIVFGTDILYIQRGQRTLASFRYSIMNDGFESMDETVQSDEIALENMNQIVYVQGKPNRAWISTDDGRLLTLVYNRSEDASAWNNHILGGEASVMSIASEPQDDKTFRLWAFTEQTVNGVIRRYVQYTARNPRIPERTDFYSGPTAEDKEVDENRYINLLFEAQKRQVHLDCAGILDTTQSLILTPGAITGDDIVFTVSDDLFSAGDVGRRLQVKYLTGDESGIAVITEVTDATTVVCNILQDFVSTDPIPSGAWYFTQDTVSNLGYLEGETVRVVADGGLEEDEEVVNGQITLGGQTTYVIVGQPYYGRIKTMPSEILLSTGITPGRTKTVNKISLMFRNALGVSYGYDPYNLQQIGFRIGGQYTDRPTRLYNGVKEVPGFDLWDDQRSVWVVQTSPYPCTLNAMIMDVEVDFEGGV